MKVLFLDHDGVICLAYEWGSRFKSKETFDRFNDKAVKILNQIILETDCEIVISSDWRFHCSLQEMQELYQVRGIKKLPIGYTPNDLDLELFKDVMKADRSNELEITRCFEIKAWLEAHPDVTHWVAVDDMDLSYLDNFVQTPKRLEGIKQSGIKEKILKFLNDK